MFSYSVWENQKSLFLYIIMILSYDCYPHYGYISLLAKAMFMEQSGINNR